MNKILLLTTLFISLINLQAQNKLLDSINSLQEFVYLSKKGKWKEVKKKKGISLNYRDLIFNDTIKTRLLSAKFKLNSNNFDSVIYHLKLPKHIKLWNNGIRDINILKSEDSYWVSHAIYDIPFPFKQKDLVTYSTISKKDSFLILSSKSLPNFIKPQKGVTREGYNLSEWRLKLSTNSTIDVEFCALSLTKSKIPKFLRDPILQRILVKSFANLKESFNKKKFKSKLNLPLILLLNYLNILN